MKALRISRAIAIALSMLTVMALAACAQPSATPTVAPVSKATTVPATATKAAVAQPTATTIPPTAIQAAATKPAPTALPPTVAPTQPPARTTPGVVNSGSALDAIIKAGRAQLAAKAWRSNMTTEMGTTILKNIVEFVAPDHFHITGETEMLIIGQKTYIKQGVIWVLFPVDMSALIAQYANAATITEMEAGITDAKLVGPDTLDGKATLVYTYKSLYVISGLPINSTVKMWVSTADGLPRKQEVEGEVSGVKSKTTNLIEYPTDLKIEAPAP